MTTLGKSSNLFVRKAMMGVAVTIAGFGSSQVGAQTKRPSTTNMTKPTKPTNNFRGPAVPRSPWDDTGRFQDRHRGPKVESDRASQNAQPSAAQPAARQPAPAPAFDREKS